MDKNMNEFLWNLLLKHYGHKVEIAVYGTIDDPMSVTIEDMDTHEIIIDAELYTLQSRDDVRP